MQDVDRTTYVVTLITTTGRYRASEPEFKQELETTRAAIEHSLGSCGPEAPGTAFPKSGV
jgi:hypothetical protein